jgi:uncharacterized protein
MVRIRKANKGSRTAFGRARAAALFLLASIATPAVPASPAPFVPAPSIVRATPALWEVRDADTTIYLFGTFHTLDGRTVWFDHHVRDAFNSSGELVLETIVPQSREEMRAAGRVVDAGSGKVKPFIAQTRQAISDGRSLGLSVEHGADAVLRRVAEDEGKLVGGLEKFEEQLGALAKIPASQPPASGNNAVTVSMNDLLAAWTNGDTHAFSTMLQGFEAKAPVAYRMLIADRNARWGQWIADRLDRPGTVFVAVGSGHLAGKDSVQQWLASRGISSTRVG